MKVSSITILLLIMSCLNSFSQTINDKKLLCGYVRNAETGKALQNVVVKLKADANSSRMSAYALTRSDGSFEIKARRMEEKGYLVFSLLGYETYTVELVKSNVGEPVNVALKPFDYELEEIVVRPTSIEARGDTVAFLAGSFISPTTITLADLICKMPGLSVDKRGRIEYQGERIKKFYIEGLDLLSSDYNMATLNIQANDVSMVEVLENDQPIKLLKGVEHEELASINIKLKKSALSRLKGTLDMEAGSNLPYDKKLAAAKLFCMNISSQKQYMATLGGSNYSRYNTLHKRARKSSAKISIPSNPFSKAPLADNRYIDLKQLGGRLGSIKKIAKNKEYKYNISLTRENEKYSSISESEYFTPQGKIKYSEVALPDAETYALAGNISILNNSDNHYLDEKIDIMAGFEKDDILVDKDSYNLEQRARVRNIEIKNILKYKRKNNKGNISSFDNVLNISINPNSEYSVPSQYEKYAYNQSLSQLTAQTLFAGSYVWMLGDISSISLGYQTDLNYTQVKTNLNSGESENNTRQARANNIANLSYQWNPNSWKVIFSLKGFADAMHFSYLKPLSEDKENYNKINSYWGLSNSIFCHCSANTKIYLKNNYRDTRHISFSDFVMNTIRYSYMRESSSRSIDNPNSQDISSMLYVEYKDPIQGMFSKINIGYVHKRKNTINSIEITPDGYMGSRMHLTNSSSNLKGNLFFSKRFFSIKTTVTSQISVNIMKNRLVRNSINMEANNKSVAANIRISTNPFRWINIEAEGGWGSMKSEIENTSPNKSDNYESHGSLTFLPTEKLHFGLSHNYSYRSKDNFGNSISSSFLDASISYEQKRWRYELLANNLLGEDVYQEVSYKGGDVFVNTYFLRQREMLLKLSYRF